jgi:uncharacterized protein (TIGR02284 family)
MSTDAQVTKQLMKTLENGREGYLSGAEKLAESSSPQLADTFRRLSGQREDYYNELQELASDYGDSIEEDAGSVPGAIHRGWMAVKDFVTGSSPESVLNTADQGEDHAMSDYDDALTADISEGLRSVVERQRAGVKAAQDEVRSLRDTQD